MEDEAFIELKNKFLIGLVVALIFIIPLVIFFYRNIPSTESTITKSIDKKKDIIVLITDSKHSKYKNIMNQVNIKKITIDKYKDSEYLDLLDKLDIAEKDIVIPTVIYIKKGKQYATLINIKKEEELQEFLNEYEVIE